MVFLADGGPSFQRIRTAEGMDTATLSELLRIYWQAYQLEALISRPQFRFAQYLFDMSPDDLRNPTLDLRHLSPRIDRVFASAEPALHDRLAPIRISGVRIGSPGIVEFSVVAGFAFGLFAIVGASTIALDRISGAVANHRRRNLALRQMEAEVDLFERAVAHEIEDVDIGRVTELARVLNSTRSAQQIERLAISRQQRLTVMKSDDLIDFEEPDETSFLDGVPDELV